MPPRYSYWTIIAGGLPTAFRAAERDDLVPTFKRILEKHPDAEMKWFARGKIWESPEAAREDTEARRRPPEGGRAPLGERPPAPPSERRGRDWRPGGEHRDPRQKFKDAKKKGNQDRRQERFDRKQRSPQAETPGDKPPASRPPSRPPFQARPPYKPGAPDTRDKRDWRDRPPRRRPEGAKAGPPREKPHGDPLKRDVPPAGRPPFQTRPPFKGRPPFKARPPFNRDAPPRDRESGPDTPKPWRGGGGAGPPRPTGRRDGRPGGPKPPRSGGGGGRR